MLDVRELIPSIVALLVIWQYMHADQRVSYICPQCGSRRQDGHSDDCSWK